MQVDLFGAAKKVQTFFLLARSTDPGSGSTEGENQIVLVNNNNETVAKSKVYDTGIFKLDHPGEATSMIVRRITGGGDSGNSWAVHSVAHIRAYQCNNLLSNEYGTTIHAQTEAVDANHTAQNLINNLESRSSRNDWNAYNYDDDTEFEQAATT